MPLKRIGVLVSGGGSNLQAILDAIDRGEIHGSVSVVIANRAEAYALERARQGGIPAFYVNPKQFDDKEQFDHEIIAILKHYQVDLVVLAGYLSILSPAFISQYRNRIINIHPSLIPSFCGKGYYGERVHRAVLEYGAKVTGATVHFVDEGTDTGAIILQEAIAVEPNDDVHSLAFRVLTVEHRILPKAIQLFCEGKINIEGRKVAIRKESQLIDRSYSCKSGR